MPKRFHHLETAPTIDAEPPATSSETEHPSSLESPEAEPLRESAETVRQLLDSWKAEYDAVVTAPDRKQELAYVMVKLAEAVQIANLHPDEIKIRESEPGVLGFYVPSTGEIAITPAGLALAPEHYSHVLVHEATHAGKQGVGRISDEGLTEIHTRRQVGTMHGIYESEQRDAEKTFSEVGMQKVLEHCDFDQPKELIELYLDIEWRDAWRDRWEKEAVEHGDPSTEEGRKELLEGSMKDWIKELEENFKEAAPRLLEKAEQEGFDFAQAHREKFAAVVEEATKAD